MKQMAIGIMSGTSLDGIDVVVANIEGTYLSTKVEIVAFQTIPIDEPLKEEIRQAMNEKAATPALLSSLNMKLGYAFGHAAKKVCEDAHISLELIDFAASHGQTIWHINENQGHLIQSSLQLGDPSAIASILKTTVVSNFRNADIASGGVGAPLVPYVDFILFSDPQRSRSLHNLGGISNLTYLPKGASENDVIALDTGPANMMIDHAMQILYQKPYDENGQIAKQGKLIPKLYQEIMNYLFFRLEPPKSTGREVFGNQLTDQIISTYSNEKPEDIIHTLTMITIQSIVDAYQTWIIPKHGLDEIIFSGGGAYNSFILESIQKQLPETKILKLEDLGFHSKAKEALAFLILGHETLSLKPSNLLKATGAKRKVILGQVTYWV